jgi:hypothetical protein
MAVWVAHPIPEGGIRALRRRLDLSIGLRHWKKAGAPCGGVVGREGLLNSAPRLPTLFPRLPTNTESVLQEPEVSAPVSSRTAGSGRIPPLTGPGKTEDPPPVQTEKGTSPGGRARFGSPFSCLPPGAGMVPAHGRTAVTSDRGHRRPLRPGRLRRAVLGRVSAAARAGRRGDRPSAVHALLGADAPGQASGGRHRCRDRWREAYRLGPGRDRLAA